MHELHTAGHEVAYCDTDSIVTTGELAEGKELGDWKLEGEYNSAEFLSSKVYALFSSPNKLAVDIPSGKPFIKCKGFRLPKSCYAESKSPDDWFSAPELFWSQLKSGAKMIFETTRGFKTGVAEGDIRFKRILVSRGFAQCSTAGCDLSEHSLCPPRMDKREFALDGNSTPWDTAEYERRYY